MSFGHANRTRNCWSFWSALCGVSCLLVGGCEDKPITPVPIATTEAPKAFEILDVSDDSFQKDVLESPIPVLADYWAPWCGPCLNMAPVFKELATEFHGKIRFVKINIDENPRLSARFVTQGIPLMVAFRKGKALGYTVGFGSTTKDDVASFLKKIDSIPDPQEVAGEIPSEQSSEDTPGPKLQEETNSTGTKDSTEGKTGETEADSKPASSRTEPGSDEKTSPADAGRDGGDPAKP